jgi:hypothetical protein
MGGCSTRKRKPLTKMQQDGAVNQRRKDEQRSGRTTSYQNQMWY